MKKIYIILTHTGTNLSKLIKSYTFNILGLFAVGFHKKIKMKHSFYCAEFVKYVIEQAEIPVKLPDIIRPEDFKDIEGLQEIYSGFLRKYQSSRGD